MIIRLIAASSVRWWNSRTTREPLQQSEPDRQKGLPARSALEAAWLHKLHSPSLRLLLAANSSARCSSLLVPRFGAAVRPSAARRIDGGVFLFSFFLFCFCFKTRCAAQRPPPESLEKCGLSLASHVTAPTTLTARLFPAARLGHLRVRMRCVRNSPRVDERAQRRVFRIRYAKKNKKNSASKSVHRMLNFKKKTFISYRSRWRYLLLF